MTDPTPRDQAPVADDALDVAMTDPAAVSAPPEIVAPEPTPRTRWAGIVWGLVLAALAVAGIWLTGHADRVDAVSDWLQQLDVGTAIASGLLALGALVLVLGVTGLLRRAQRALADRS